MRHRVYIPKSATAQNNVTITSDSPFIIPANSTFNIDFLNNYLEIKNGSSVIIRETGKLD